MVFSDLLFIFVFIPLFILSYMAGGWIDRRRKESDPAIRRPLLARNMALVVFSLLFYAWGEPVYVLLMLLSVLVNFMAGRAIDACVGRGWRKAWLFIGVALDLVILGSFKYLGFFAGALAELGIAVNVPEIALPIGISFYIFQSISYLVDVYRRESPVQRNFMDLLLYIAMFPQLIAGPIVKYHDIEEQIENRTVTLEGFSYGVKRFIFGLGKKVILANTFAEVVDAVYAYQAADVSQAMLWLTALLYMLQIYFDFSGYSDMAIGLGKMFGFTFIENFRLPYTATSIQDFWRKWHISLSSWFKEYVYIPLGGNRRGTARTYVNLWTVFLLTGIWHGAGWTFIFWGIYHGFFNVLERCFLGKWLKQEKFRPLAHIYAVFVVLIGWIFFRADTIGQAFSFIRYMFVPHSAVVLMERYMNRKLWMFLAAALLACGPVQWFWMICYDK